MRVRYESKYHAKCGPESLQEPCIMRLSNRGPPGSQEPGRASQRTWHFSYSLKDSVLTWLRGAGGGVEGMRRCKGPGV